MCRDCYAVVGVGKLLGRQQCVEYSDCHRKETVAKSCDHMDAPVPSAKYQENKAPKIGLKRFLHNAGGLTDAVVRDRRH